MANSISNSDDIIDSRDVIKRIAELESEIEDAYESDKETAVAEGTSEDTFPPIVEWMESETCPALDEVEELRTLKSLQEQAEGYSDWTHGATLIRDSYFEKYAEELADDLGLLPKDAAWPATCIDWEKAATELQADYTSVDFDGIDYWIR